MKRAAAVVLFVSVTLAAAPCLAEDRPAQPPKVLDNEGLLRKYVWSTLGAEGALHATLWSALEQWRGAPVEWGTDASGYTKRWASEYAASAIGSATKYAVASIWHHDPSFTRCQCIGVGLRMRHALLAPFTARARDGRRVFSPAIVAGLAAEDITPAVTWYPTSHGVRNGVAHAGSGVLSKMAVDVFREFVTFRKRKPGP